jgi:DNA-binding Xre family transcriptional regulator
MIVYDQFWKTLKESGETTYTLITRHHISSATIDKLRKNKPLNTTTLNDLCQILGCGLSDIAEYEPSPDDQFL